MPLLQRSTLLKITVATSAMIILLRRRLIAREDLTGTTTIMHPDMVLILQMVFILQEFKRCRKRG